jgi:hypothetical protein
MTHFDRFAGPPGHAGVLRGLDNIESALASTRFGVPPRDALSFMGLAVFCRPHS